MSSEINNSVLSKPTVTLAGDYAAKNKPGPPDSGAQFATEFERAQKAAGNTQAELRHSDRQQAEAVQSQRTDRRETGKNALDKAQSGREQAGEVREERNAKSTTRSKDLTAEQAQVSIPTEARNQKVTPQAGEERGASRPAQREATAASAETGKGHQEKISPEGQEAQAASAAVSGGVVQAKGGSAATNASSSPLSAAPAVSGASAGGQANLGQQSQMGQRETVTPSKVAPATEPPVTSETADIMERLIVDREERIDREASILRQLKSQLSPNSREISMQLSPAALGRVQMTLALREGRFSATVRTETREALEALQRQLPELQMALEKQGFEVVNFDLEMAVDFESGLGLKQGLEQANPTAPKFGNTSLAESMKGGGSNPKGPLLEAREATKKAATQRGGLDTWV